MLTKAPRGTRDILPEETPLWRELEEILHETCRQYGYEEIRMPVFEHTELFRRSVGDSTDIVQKEMYTFDDKAGRSLSLRPEGTAGVVRGFIEHGMSSKPMPVRLYYMITAYRYENVQKGRYREFHQFGAEAFGAVGPEIDAELIGMVAVLLERAGVKRTNLHINSIGCPACREPYTAKLRAFAADHREVLCETCRQRTETNPMRILDCKVPSCRGILSEAPVLSEFLCPDCVAHFNALRERLNGMGIAYCVDRTIVRGLDYYTRTVFEFVSDSIGAQGTVCAGGRYDGLVEACGGNPVPGIGFALGMERLLLQRESEGVVWQAPSSRRLFIAHTGPDAIPAAAKLAHDLRCRGVVTERELTGRSFKSQMKYAGKDPGGFMLVIGEQEMRTGIGRMKNMATGEETEVRLDAEAVAGIWRRETSG